MSITAFLQALELELEVSEPCFKLQYGGQPLRGAPVVGYMPTDPEIQGKMAHATKLVKLCRETYAHRTRQPAEVILEGSDALLRDRVRVEQGGEPESDPTLCMQPLHVYDFLRYGDSFAWADRVYWGLLADAFSHAGISWDATRLCPDVFAALELLFARADKTAALLHRLKLHWQRATDAGWDLKEVILTRMADSTQCGDQSFALGPTKLLFSKGDRGRANASADVDDPDDMFAHIINEVFRLWPSEDGWWEALAERYAAEENTTTPYFRPLEFGWGYGWDAGETIDLGKLRISDGLVGASLPAWADCDGTDAHGYWASFSIPDRQGNKITQRMRWIPPGQFWMGSHEDEPGRLPYESPRHQVTLSQGYWLFDTACTQALWEAVMGDNPSNFKGADRPVEIVSWNDVQKFIARINERLPGLDLVLPSEAQWEYACRADTSTPFSFGGDITPAQVNYDGGYPCPGGQKGQYREETVDVKALPCNDWGLYQMHGNVWEWCQDHWHEGYYEAPSDGSVWEGSGAGAGRGRVVRGGSWNDVAYCVRAAFRTKCDPDFRASRLGFRCARGSH